MMKSCFKTLSILIGMLCAPLVLWVASIVLVLNPKIDEEVSRYNGLCITATERYDLYIERLTGLQGKRNAHDVTPLAAIIVFVDWEMKKPQQRHARARLATARGASVPSAAAPAEPLIFLS